MSVYIVVLPAMKSGRIDRNMLGQIAEIALAGRPLLICINQFSRYLDLWEDAEEADEACQAIRKSIVDLVPSASPFVQVYLTEFREYDVHFDKMKARNIKSVEDVSRQCLCSQHQFYVSASCAFVHVELVDCAEAIATLTVVDILQHMTYCRICNRHTVSLHAAQKESEGFQVLSLLLQVRAWIYGSAQECGFGGPVMSC